MRVITAIYITIVFKFIYPFFVRYCNFPDIKSMYVNSILFGLFLYSWLIYPALPKAKARWNSVMSKYKIMFCIFFSLILLSSILNYDHWFIFFKSIIDYYFPYVFLFLTITRIKLSEKEETIFIKLCYSLIILQIPIVLMQYIFGGYSSADSIDGTVSSIAFGGGTGITGVLSVFLFSVCMSRILITKVTPRYLLLGFLAFVPPIFGGSRGGLILMILAVIVLSLSMIWVGEVQNFKRFVKVIFSIFMFSIIVYFVFVEFVPKYKFASFLEFDTFKDRQSILYYDNDVGSQRIWGYLILTRILFKGWIDLLFGLGYGSMAGSLAFDSKANKIIQAYFPLGAPDSIFVMLTIGSISLVLMIIILIYGVVWVKRYLKIETCPFMRINGYAFIPITVACLASIPYTRVWSTQIGLTYWVLAGVLLSRYRVLSAVIGSGNRVERM